MRIRKSSSPLSCASSDPHGPEHLAAEGGYVLPVWGHLVFRGVRVLGAAAHPRDRGLGGVGCPILGPPPLYFFSRAPLLFFWGGRWGMITGD